MEALKKLRTLCMIALVAVGLFGAGEAVAHGGASVSFQTFYDELAPYGRWIHNPSYGYVWAPNVEAGFQPYATRGHWVMTEYGNTWVSDYSWGWAPFHYGRWLYDDFYGWVWVPGHEWGPAWVHWRTGGDYYGWAPLGPGMHINVAINIPMGHWVFVPRRYITHPRIYRYCVPRTRVVNIYHNTTIINNYYNYSNRTYVYGPRAQEIEQHTRKRVQVYQVNNESRPGRNVVDRNAVRMYRPEIATERPGRNEAPTRVVTRETGGRPDRSSLDGSQQSRTDQNQSTEGRNRISRESYGRPAEQTRGTNAPENSTRVSPGNVPEREVNRSYQPSNRVEMERPSRSSNPVQRPTGTEGTIRRRYEPAEGSQPGTSPNMQQQPMSRPVERTRTATPMQREQQPIPIQQPQRQERPVRQASQPQPSVQPQQREVQRSREIQPQREAQPQPQRQAPTQRPAPGRPTRNQ